MMFWPILIGLLIGSAISAAMGIPPIASLVMAAAWLCVGIGMAVSQ